MEYYVATPTVSHEIALKAVSVAISEGLGLGVNVAACVVDPALGLVSFGRADGTMPHSVETSRRKANTAASSRRPSGWMQGEFALELPLGTGNLLTNIRGGFPLIFDGKIVGGLGVAGGTPDQDVEVAILTLASIGVDARKGS